MTFYTEYSYLSGSLQLLFVFIICFIVGKGIRKQILLSAILSAPFGLLSILFVPEYWDPVRIIGGYRIGIEDIIFSFANGGIVWFFSTFPFKNRISTDIKVKKLLKHYFLISSSVVLYGLMIFGYKPMDITIIGIILLISVLVYLRKSLWKLALTGALFFGAFYTIAFYTINLHPGFIAQWNLQALSGYFIIGIPIEEIAWSICFGAVWPLIMAFCFDVKNIKENL